MSFSASARVTLFFIQVSILNLSSLGADAAGRFAIGPPVVAAAAAFATAFTFAFGGAFAAAFAAASTFAFGGAFAAAFAATAASTFAFAVALRSLRAFDFGLGPAGSGAAGSDADVFFFLPPFTAALAAAMSSSTFPN